MSGWSREQGTPLAVDMKSGFWWGKPKCDKLIKRRRPCQKEMVYKYGMSVCLLSWKDCFQEGKGDHCISRNSSSLTLSSSSGRKAEREKGWGRRGHKAREPSGQIMRLTGSKEGTAEPSVSGRTRAHRHMRMPGAVPVVIKADRAAKALGPLSYWWNGASQGCRGVA